MKLKTIYICNKCEYESPKWIGRCPQCESWNSFTEDVVEKKKLSLSGRKVRAAEVTPLIDSQKNEHKKLISGILEFDRVLGGGFVPGSLTLLSGEPGIGKSTLTLQIADSAAKTTKTLLISGEESISQIASRATRLGLQTKNLLAINEFSLETILETVRIERPGFVIIDSIQTISSQDIPSNSGSISQVRYCTEQILELSKTSNIPIILISHVTKDGNLAGPKTMEHLVDSVLHLEGDRFQQFRLLRANKNRFGSCHEVGIFEMTEQGLQEIHNPSEQFLSGRKKDAIGSALTISVEGTRPFIIEVQALVSSSPFGYPKRTANGFDLNRLQLLIAVLEKYGRLNLQNQDVFVNVVGGIKLNEPASDLAILLAIASSLLKKSLPSNSVIFGEVGLSGELRKVSHHDKRLKEAKKMELTQIISPEKFNEITTVLKTI